MEKKWWIDFDFSCQQEIHLNLSVLLNVQIVSEKKDSEWIFRARQLTMKNLECDY